MMKANNWGKMLIAYGMWAVFIFLGIIFLVVSRNSLSSYLDAYYIQGIFQRGKEAQFINQAYFFVFGMALLILMIVVEEYFKNGARKNKLARRIARVMGIEMLFIFAASAANMALMGYSLLLTLVLVAELALAALLIWFGFKIPRKQI
jgi:hypothetical protein